MPNFFGGFGAEAICFVGLLLWILAQPLDNFLRFGRGNEPSEVDGSSLKKAGAQAQSRASKSRPGPAIHLSWAGNLG
jgi:hypothetical protein